MRWNHCRFVFVVMAGGACASGSTDQTTPLVGVELLVRPQVITLRAGETSQLAAQVNDSMGRPIGGAPLAFLARANGLLRVTRDGLVSAIGAAGRDSIAVISKGLTRNVQVTIGAGPTSVIEVLSGDHQEGQVGSTLGSPIVVALRDAYGNPVSRTPVVFTAEAGGHVKPATITSDAAGIARATWGLGGLGGTQSLRVRADSASTVIPGIARPGDMTAVEQVGTVPRHSIAGDTVPVRLRATDAFGNAVPSVVMTFEVSGGKGEVQPPRAETDSTGIVQVNWRTGTTVAANALRVRAQDIRDTTFVLALRTVAGSPMALQVVSGQNQRVRAGSAARPPVIRVVDRHGNVVAGTTVHFSTSDSAVVEPADAVTNPLGLVTPQRWILGADPEYVLLVAADGLNDTLRIRARTSAKR